jgi:hypothetical protein
MSLETGIFVNIGDPTHQQSDVITSDASAVFRSLPKFRATIDRPLRLHTWRFLPDSVIEMHPTILA